MAWSSFALPVGFDERDFQFIAQRLELFDVQLVLAPAVGLTAPEAGRDGAASRRGRSHYVPATEEATVVVPLTGLSVAAVLFLRVDIVSSRYPPI